MIAKKNLYLNADKTKIVPEDSEDAAFLLVGKGVEIPKETIEKYNLSEKDSGGGEKASVGAAENKAKSPNTNK